VIKTKRLFVFLAMVVASCLIKLLFTVGRTSQAQPTDFYRQSLSIQSTLRNLFRVGMIVLFIKHHGSLLVFLTSFWNLQNGPLFW